MPRRLVCSKAGLVLAAVSQASYFEGGMRRWALSRPVDAHLQNKHSLYPEVSNGTNKKRREARQRVSCVAKSPTKTPTYERHGWMLDVKQKERSNTANTANKYQII
jgi:hypothetical protein